jgi:hypothetical protein
MTAAQEQAALQLRPFETRQITPMEMADRLLANSDNPKDAVEVLQELFKLHTDMERARAEAEFNDALTRCQSEIGVIANDAQGQKKPYATYKALDKVVRPVYLRNNLNVSFGSGPCNIPNHIMVTCDVSLRSYSRHYEIPMDASGLGPKGDGALSKPHAILAAAEYGRRILLKMIFNIVTGEEDTVTNGELAEDVHAIEMAFDKASLWKLYNTAADKYESTPSALKLLNEAKRKRSKELEPKR